MFRENEVTVSKLRYRFEVPMIIIGFIILFVVIMATLFLILSDIESPDWLLVILIALLAPVLAFFTIRKFYMETITNGVEITENQLPDIYKVFIELSTEMGFDKKIETSPFILS